MRIARVWKCAGWWDERVSVLHKVSDLLVTLDPRHAASRSNAKLGDKRKTREDLERAICSPGSACMLASQHRRYTLQHFEIYMYPIRVLKTPTTLFHPFLR